MEIIVVDGMSDDGTRKILSEYSMNYPFIKFLDNPKRITPAALNIGVKASKGDIIIRVDAHAVYEANYISTLVNGLIMYKAENIGGIRNTALIHDSPVSLAISVAISHPFTAGNAYYRTGSDNVREVDTVWCGCFRKDLFDRIGYYNENIIRTEDRDFNARIREINGRIILDPSTKCTYFPRTELWNYCKWNTYGPFRLFYNHKFTHVKMVSWRNFVPALFILYHLVVAFAFFYSPSIGLFISIPLVLYWLLVFFFSLQKALFFKSVFLVPAMFLVTVITHYGYGLGSLGGMPWYLFRKKALKGDLF